jgi:hypothetical protein
MSTVRELVLQLGDNLRAAVTDPHVWVAIAIAFAVVGFLAVVGFAASRQLRLIAVDAPAGEVIAVSLAVGTLVVTTIWAAVASSGRSAFTPIAVAFAACVVWRLLSRPRHASNTNRVRSIAERLQPPSFLGAIVAAAAFIVLVGVAYGATIAPSPRDGVQPVEFLDEAFYSVLSADLSKNGVESLYSPSGFEQLPGLPSQAWYHWGEVWLASAVMDVSGIDPTYARHYVVLPITLLAAAALTGTLVRRLGATCSRRAFVFGGAACLFLAPIPIPGTFFGQWARGGLFGVTMYGMAMSTILLVAYLFLHRAPSAYRDRTWLVFVCAASAALIPLHVVLAGLAAIGFIGCAFVAIAISLVREGHLPRAGVETRAIVASTFALGAATVVWGVATGHGIGASGLSGSVDPFNDAWRESVAKTTIGSLMIGSVVVVLLKTRRTKNAVFWLALAATGIVVFGAFAWGARLGDFTMFHVYFGAMAVMATPVAAVAIWMIVRDLDRASRHAVALGLALVTVIQIEVGVLTTVVRLQEFGPHDYPAIATSLLDAIRGLPADAKVAYSCQPREELAFWNPRLEAITAHTGRPIMPMCFQAEFFPAMNGVPDSLDTASPLFEHAPQRSLFPTAAARPSSDQTTSFLRSNGIDYIYADARHPNSLVPSAVPVIEAGGASLLRLP